MNQENYCSLNVAKRLIDTGIVLETDFVWRLGADGWKLLNKDWVTNMMSNTYESYPAPSFTEVWRELPWYVLRDDVNCQLQIEKYNTFTAAYYDGTGPNYTSENPTDALAELLIWAKGQEVV